MSKIIILRGNSGSGKTTVSKVLQRKIGRGTLLISQYYVRREMLWVDDKPNNQAIDLLDNLVTYGCQNCDCVFGEGILSSDNYKSLFKKIKEIFIDKIYAYYFDLPFEETLKRHKQKSISHEFGEKEMRGWWREKEPQRAYLAHLSLLLVTFSKSNARPFKLITLKPHLLTYGGKRL